jgi:hypothetical protein
MPGFDEPRGEVGPDVAGSAKNDDLHEQEKRRAAAPARSSGAKTSIINHQSINHQ